ncbi:hypothetical protein AVEN_258748-1 [Araneus ventricosus]|uniref:Secreted protein n=1 Tax=Araneus ventricosus TaxID=182803 RepID=A0A4Y2D2E3_ARAVE|nr:hypothetical protein AVEN_258748-1 [Araneus ventricosus]
MRAILGWALSFSIVVGWQGRHLSWHRLSKLPHHSSGRACDPPTYDLACSGPTYAAAFRWRRVSELEPFGLEAETLPLGYRGPFRTRVSLG